MSRPLFVGSYLQSHGELSANVKKENNTLNDNVNSLIPPAPNLLS